MFKWKTVVVILTLFLLAGCENAEIKKTLQIGFDNANPSGQRGICFIVGNIDYPYTTKDVVGETNEYGYNLQAKRNESLNNRLAMFARLGLLSEKSALDDKGQPTSFYQYEFTNEGKKYAGRYPKNDQFFCFGRIVVDSVDGMVWSNMEKTLGDITYKYHVEGHIPDWAKSPELNMIRRLSKDNEPIDWSSQIGFWPFKKTTNGLKAIVPPGVHIIGT